MKPMMFEAFLLAILSSGANGAGLRAHPSVIAIRQNKTINKLPYMLDKCTSVKGVYGNTNYVGKSPMTLNLCHTFCSARNKLYFGVRNGQECWCGSHYKANNASNMPCDVPCKGDANFMCGGKHATSVYLMGKGPHWMTDEELEDKVDNADEDGDGKVNDEESLHILKNKPKVAKTQKIKNEVAKIQKTMTGKTLQHPGLQDFRRSVKSQKIKNMIAKVKKIKALKQSAHHPVEKHWYTHYYYHADNKNAKI